MASGRTLTYRINGEFWALEHYYPGTDRVQLQLYDGSCMDGTWDYVAPLYCFHWDGQGTSCFRHARLGDEVLIIESQGGVDTPITQSMTAVTDTPLACGPSGDELRRDDRSDPRLAIRVPAASVTRGSSGDGVWCRHERTDTRRSDGQQPTRT